MKKLMMSLWLWILVPCPVFSAAPGEIQPAAVIPPSTGGDFTLTHYTIDGGYAVLAGGVYTLRGIVGQPDAGISEGNDTVFVGGFISTSVPLESTFLFSDSFENQ